SMAESIRPEPRPPQTRIRRAELVRQVAQRRAFPTREAQRILYRKERMPWAPIAYAVFLVVTLLILSTAYATYAFSRYRDQTLPGVYVSDTPLGLRTEAQARTIIT